MIANNNDQHIFDEYSIFIDRIDDFVSLHPVWKFCWIRIPWLVHAKLWSCHNFDILVEKINMLCYSWNGFCAYNHLPHKLLFHPKITYILDIVSYRYILTYLLKKIVATIYFEINQIGIMKFFSFHTNKYFVKFI